MLHDTIATKFHVVDTDLLEYKTNEGELYTVDLLKKAEENDKQLQTNFLEKVAMEEEKRVKLFKQKEQREKLREQRLQRQKLQQRK